MLKLPRICASFPMRREGTVQVRPALGPVEGPVGVPSADPASPLALIRDFGKQPRQIPLQPPLHALRPYAIFSPSLSKRSLYDGSKGSRLQRIPDYFTEEEAVALVDAARSYPTRMAFRVMLRTGLRVSEASALRRVDLRLDQASPIIVVRADSPGNKARRGRAVPVLAGPGPEPARPGLISQ